MLKGELRIKICQICIHDSHNPSPSKERKLFTTTSMWILMVSHCLYMSILLKFPQSYCSLIYSHRSIELPEAEQRTSLSDGV